MIKNALKPCASCLRPPDTAVYMHFSSRSTLNQMSYCAHLWQITLGGVVGGGFDIQSTEEEMGNVLELHGTS